MYDLGGIPDYSMIGYLSIEFSPLIESTVKNWGSYLKNKNALKTI